ncbi:unnamed protein product, partial [Symbiodinium sp. CCMP2456]
MVHCSPCSLIRRSVRSLLQGGAEHLLLLRPALYRPSHMSTLSRWFHILSAPIPELDDMVPSRFAELYLSLPTSATIWPCQSLCTGTAPEPSARLCVPRRCQTQKFTNSLVVEPRQQLHMVGYEGLADQVEVTRDGLKFHAL